MIKEVIKGVLTTMGEDIIQQANRNLVSSKISSSGHLGKGMDSNVKINNNSVGLTITLAGYWEYMNYGVAGVGGTKADKKVNGKIIKGENWKLKKVTNNKYKYRDKMPPPSAFAKITSSKGGQFAIARSIFHTGLKTTLFFSNPFDSEVKELSDEIEVAIAKAVEDSLNKETI